MELREVDVPLAAWRPDVAGLPLLRRQVTDRYALLQVSLADRVSAFDGSSEEGRFTTHVDWSSCIEQSLPCRAMREAFFVSTRWEPLPVAQGGLKRRLTPHRLGRRCYNKFSSRIEAAGPRKRQEAAMRVDLAGKVALVTGSAQGHRPRHRRHARRQRRDRRLQRPGPEATRSTLRRPASLRAIDVSERDSILAGVERGACGGPAASTSSSTMPASACTADERKTVDEFPVEAWDKLHRDRPHRRLPDEPGRHPAHEGGGRRAHHQHRLGARPGADAAAELLRRRQGRRGEPHPLDGARARAARHPRQRHRAGLDGDRGLGQVDPSSPRRRRTRMRG